jgi:endonuclease/exonuclease/phosphatase family metal-dependent hydrolase
MKLYLKTRADKIIFIFTIILLVCLLFTYLPAISNPENSSFISFFGLVYVPVLFLNVIMLLYWLIRLNMKIFLLILVGILAGYHIFLNTFSFHAAAGIKKHQELRLMTYNVNHFKNNGDKGSSRHKQVITLIDSLNPDIVCLQDWLTKSGKHFNTLSSLMSSINAKYKYWQPLTRGRIGMAIVSKYPIISSGLVRFSKTPDNDYQCLYADIKIGNRLIRVYNVHLQSFGLNPTELEYINGASSQAKKKENISALAIMGKFQDAFITRSRQVKAIKAHIKNCPYPFAIAGDFNDTPASYTVNSLASHLQNAFREKGAGLGTTYHYSFLNFQIDYILMSRQAFTVKNYAIVKSDLSDHYPVYTDIEFVAIKSKQ